MATYIPDDLSKNSLNREYLLSVSYLYNFLILAVIRKDKWLKLCKGYKEMVNKRPAKAWEDYSINLSKETIEKIKSFIPSERYYIIYNMLLEKEILSH